MLARLAYGVLEFLRFRVVTEYADGTVRIEINEEDWDGFVGVLDFISREAHIKPPESIDVALRVLEQVVLEDNHEKIPTPEG